MVHVFSTHLGIPSARTNHRVLDRALVCRDDRFEDDIRCERRTFAYHPPIVLSQTLVLHVAFVVDVAALLVGLGIPAPLGLAATVTLPGLT